MGTREREGGEEEKCIRGEATNKREIAKEAGLYSYEENAIPGSGKRKRARDCAQR